MEIITTLKMLHSKLPAYGFEPEIETVLAEYLLFLRDRADLLELAQTYHDDIFENNRYTLGQVEGLPANDGKENGLLFAALYLARCERLPVVLAKRGVPAEFGAGALNAYKSALKNNKECYGCYGLQGMYRSSTTRYLMPVEFRLGRLLFELVKFDSAFELYRNRETGETIPVALPGFQYMPTGKRPPKTYEGELMEPYIRIDGDVMECFTFDPEGNFSATPITLKLPLYDKVLATGDNVISVHIPGEGRMTPELVDDAFKLADDFFAKHYGDMTFKAYVCSSWLLNTDMKEFLDGDSNIIRFQNRFRIVITSTNGYSLYWHIFRMQNFVPLEELKPANSFQQKFLDRVKAGQTLYNGYGYILK